VRCTSTSEEIIHNAATHLSLSHTHTRVRTHTHLWLHSCFKMKIDSASPLSLSLYLQVSPLCWFISFCFFVFIHLSLRSFLPKRRMPSPCPPPHVCLSYIFKLLLRVLIPPFLLLSVIPFKMRCFCPMIQSSFISIKYVGGDFCMKDKHVDCLIGCHVQQSHLF